MIPVNLCLTRDKWKNIALEINDMNNRLRVINKECFCDDYVIRVLDDMYDEIADHLGHMVLENRN